MTRLGRYVRASRILRRGPGRDPLATSPTVNRLHSNAPAGRPTNVRFLTLTLCITMAMLLYLDRYAQPADEHALE